ncbi:hypothetical protein JAAARDRAFT_43030 [Jaapia argillacea MUCL 33604]|uniref:histidine kinase n=1 Tax=Jaapia argillacea MUCL 33604 TaxID=933084 RepID=A0A067P2T5_9AGAM|nr:hypothetical protein JAAARDRAFT_43030 [Jaapia argillacea MUCL 33604]
MPFWTSALRGRHAESHRTSSQALNKEGESQDAPASKTEIPLDDIGGAESAGLPMPVLQSAMSNPQRRRQKNKSARIEGGFTVHWARFRHRMGTGTAPSTSENIEENGTTDSSVVRPRRFIEDAEAEEVDEVVVDRAWLDPDMKTSVTHSEHEEKTSHPGGITGTNTDHDSFATHAEGFWASCPPLIVLRWRIWPSVMEFFWVRFVDPKSENHYRKELWFMRKSLALWSAFFFILTWVIGVAFVPPPRVLMDDIFYYAITTITILPLPFLVMYDFPRDRPLFYQCYLVCSTWCWAIYQILFLYMCGYYNPNRSLFTCGKKDFIGTFYYTSGLPTIAMFGLKLDRFPSMVAALIFLILSCVLVVPEHAIFSRDILDFIVYQCFLLYVHYMRENAERRLYTLRDQLKVQFRATQKAQVNESKAADSKRRLTSYVFHEVRVPLNTALLAAQNMEASGVIGKGQEVEFRALEASLTMMSKVLNDVLDFNRLDSGRFESVSKPYAFHKAMRSLLAPIRLATDARKLELLTDFDKSIDDLSRRAMYEATGRSSNEIAGIMTEVPDEDGIVVGDEMRLRQIITNLASNACKFTPPGGKIFISTKIILPSGNLPSMPMTPDYADNSVARDYGSRSIDGSEGQGLSVKALNQHEKSLSKPLEWIVVRIEVTDTGYGIPPKEMVQSKLFSAFNQTEQGRQQGGKGTGLGLALVRQIVKRSGGRLGVRSKVGQGSTFWVELPLGVGKKALPESTPSISQTGSSQNKGFGFAVEDGVIKSLALPVDIEVDPVISPTLRNATAHKLAQSGNLASLLVHTPPALNDFGDPLSAEDSSSSHALTDPMLTPMTDDPPPIQPTTDEPRPERPLLSPGSSSSETTAGDVDTPHVETTPEPLPSKTQRPVSPIPPNIKMPARTPLPKPPPVESGLPVLVVDDDPLTRLLMSRMLTRMGCQVSTAENGELALEMIMGRAPHGCPSPMPTPGSEKGLSGQLGEGVVEDHTPSKYAVVFLDNQMPVCSGVEACKRLRAAGRRDLVVGVTGNALLSDQQEYLDAGVDHVLTKPVLERSLRNMVEVAAQRRKHTSATLDHPP